MSKPYKPTLINTTLKIKLKQLQDILDEHFLTSDKKALTSLFKKHNIFDIVSKSTGQLRNLLQRAVEIDNFVPISAIATTSSNFLISVNHQVIKISDQTEKRKIQEALAQVGIRMLLSIIKLYPDEAIEIFEVVQQSLKMTSEIFDYNYSDINDLMKFEEFTELTQTLSGKRYAEEIKEIKQTGIAAIIWTNKVPLGYLTTELKKRKWIKTQNEFSKLFINTDNNLIIHWDMKYKYELAYLLFVLAKNDLIRPRKGIFSIPEKFIVDFSGTKLKKNSLKKISSKINTDLTEYTDVITRVEQIMKNINKI